MSMMAAGTARTIVRVGVEPGTIPVVVAFGTVALFPVNARTSMMLRWRSKLKLPISPRVSFVTGERRNSVFSVVLICFRLFALSHVVKSQM